MRIFLFLLISFNLISAQELEKIEKEIRSIYKKISNSIFEIKFNRFYSTGFVFEKNVVITILPEVDTGEEVLLINNEKKIKGKIKGWDELTHIAIIEVNEDLPVPDFEKFERKFPQLALCFSLKGKGNFLFFSIYDEKSGKLYLDGVFPPGFSGAPIVDTKGKIIGILRGKAFAFENFEQFFNKKLRNFEPFFYLYDISYKIKGYTYSCILKRVNLMKERGKVYPGFLGIVIDYKEGKGIYIRKVLKN